MPLIGQKIAHYRVTAAIGSGGMGEVYRATDTRLHRDVALKVLPSEVAVFPERIERFRREARAIAALNHPHVVTIYSVEEADGFHFFTMELVDGQPLNRLIPPTGMAVSQLLHIATGLAEALAAAHAKGIIHRDLKPANVMITREETVKVLDFGLAKIAASPDSVPTLTGHQPTELRTREGVVMGTMPYMSPEQLHGQTLDHRSDLFSLGIMLYEMATGERPFRGDSSAGLVASILHDTPRPLTERRKDLPERLIGIIGRCLEKGVGDRYASARDLRSALAGVAPSEVASIGSGPTEVAAPVPPKSDNEPPPVSIAILPFSDMSATKDQDYLCEGMAEEIMNALVRIDGIRVASRTSAFRAAKSGDDVPTIARALSVGHVLEGSVRTAGVRLRVTAQLTDVATGYQLWSERFDKEAIDVFAIQDEIAAGVVLAVKSRLTPGTRTVPLRPQAHNLDAYRSYLKGRHLRGVEDFRGALSAFEEAVRLDPAHAASWTALAEITVLSAHMGLILPRAACTAARKALATANELQGESADAWHVEAFAAWLERKWEAMETAWRRALELQPDHVLALGSFALSLAARQRLEEALPLFKRAREADPLASFPYTLAGWGLLLGGRPKEALQELEDALTFQKEDASALAALSLTHVALGNLKDAIAAAERGVEVTYRAPFFLGILGWALAVAGSADDAQTILEELRTRPAGSPTVVSEAWLLGMLGRLDDAFEVLARAEDENQGLISYTDLPGFDPLRTDRRFTALLGRLGLSTAGGQAGS